MDGRSLRRQRECDKRHRYPSCLRAIRFHAGREGAAVALGLLQGTGDIDVLTFGLDHGDRCQADEQHVVGRTAFGRPFGNGTIAIFLRASTFLKFEHF